MLVEFCYFLVIYFQVSFKVMSIFIGKYAKILLKTISGMCFTINIININLMLLYLKKIDKKDVKNEFNINVTNHFSIITFKHSIVVY